MRETCRAMYAVQRQVFSLPFNSSSVQSYKPVWTISYFVALCTQLIIRPWFEDKICAVMDESMGFIFVTMIDETRGEYEIGLDLLLCPQIFASYSDTIDPPFECLTTNDYFQFSEPACSREDFCNVQFEYELTLTSKQLVIPSPMVNAFTI